MKCHLTSQHLKDICLSSCTFTLVGNLTLTLPPYSYLCASGHPDVLSNLHHHFPVILHPTYPCLHTLFHSHIPITKHLLPLPLCILNCNSTHSLLPTSLHHLRPSCFVWINHDNLTDRCFVQITLCTKNLWLHRLKANYTVIDRCLSCYNHICKNNLTILETLFTVCFSFWSIPNLFPLWSAFKNTGIECNSLVRRIRNSILVKRCYILSINWLLGIQNLPGGFNLNVVENENRALVVSLIRQHLSPFSWKVYHLLKKNNSKLLYAVSK